MPELPEVEALRRGLVKTIVGSTILEVKILNEKLVSGKGTTRYADKNKTTEFTENLRGKKIVEIQRRAKNLIIILETQEIILVHLKMTGQLVFVPDKSPQFPHKHTYIIFKLDNGTLYYNDVRQFGYVLYFKEQLPHPASPYKGEEQLSDHFKNLGLEPFSENFTLEYFKNELKKMASKSKNSFSLPIKKVLLEQKIVVGCGNIYCDEVLWASSVLPTRPIKSLKDFELEKIYENIKIILERAINSGGSSIANYLLADGKRGNYADFHNAYQKTGQKCKFKSPQPPLDKGGVAPFICTGIIEKINMSGRGTHFCQVHQI